MMAQCTDQAMSRSCLGLHSRPSANKIKRRMRLDTLKHTFVLYSESRSIRSQLVGFKHYKTDLECFCVCVCACQVVHALVILGF